MLADLDLLRNLMSGSAEAKVALAAAGLPDLLHKLWPWCVTSRRLAVAVLCTLNTLAAGCVDGESGAESARAGRGHSWWAGALPLEHEGCRSM